MKRTLVGLLFMVASSMFADEVEDYCNLVSAQAGAKSWVFASPSLFASFGNPFLLNNTTIVGGASQSLSGIVRAFTVNSAASRQCMAYASTKSLRDTATHWEDKIFLVQAAAQRPLLADALRLAEENADIEKRMFDLQNSTLSDVSNAYALRESIKAKVAEIDQRLSKLRDMPEIDTSANLREKLNESINSQAKANWLNAAGDMLQSWDIIGSGGVRYDLQTKALDGFWSVNLTYSFGQIPSTLKAMSVDPLTRKYLDSQSDSAQSQYRRLFRSQSEILEAEKINQRYIESQLNVTQELLDKTGTLDSQRVKQAKRNLVIQQLVQKASHAASVAKVQELEKWLSANAE